ncbi:MAG TPA: amidohydrolase, partial [Thermotoga sp.]|nr:amidohydrolase [Thermotoga sp.]
MSGKKAIINCNVFDFEDFKRDQYVVFTDKILEVGHMKEFTGADEVEDAQGGFLLPGIVNAHTHIYSTFARGILIPFNPKSFKDILTQLWWKLDSKLDMEAIYYSALVSAVEFIKNGITTIIDHHASGMAIRGTLNTLKKAIVDEMGLRGIFCFETSDRFDIDEAIEENLSFSKNKDEKSAGLFGLHASLSLSNETLEKISKVLGDTPIHIHVAESEEDESDSLRKYGKRVVERLEEFGLLNEDSILAHCVHINDKEASIIAERKCFVVVNPTSNMNNAVGIPNLKLFEEKGIRVLLGNDGLGYNLTRDMMNLYFSQKLLHKDPTYFSLYDLWKVLKNNY